MSTHDRGMQSTFRQVGAAVGIVLAEFSLSLRPPDLGYADRPSVESAQI